MDKTNFKLKENTGILEEISYITAVSDSYFTIADTGEVYYTPHYAKAAKLAGFLDYFTEGLEFDDGENSYDAVTKDPVLMEYFDEFCNKKKTLEMFLMIDNIVDFKKQQLLKSSPLDRLFKNLVTGFDQYAKDPETAITLLRNLANDSSAK